MPVTLIIVRGVLGVDLSRKYSASGQLATTFVDLLLIYANYVNDVDL